MKIAVLLPGHIRAWEYCKSNFMETIYDTRHNIDVFVDTYTDIFRNDYSLHKENEMGIIKNEDQVLSLFSGINVVDFKIENQIPGDPEIMQIRKILRIVKAYEQYEKLHGKYDLVIRSRCDLLLNDKLDYEVIFNNCKNSRLIYIGNGAVHMPTNDMFAICSTETFKLYGNRFTDDRIPVEYRNKVHITMQEIGRIHNVSYSQTIAISVVRLGGPGKSLTDNNISYRVFQ